MTEITNDGKIKIPAKDGNFVITLTDASGNPVTHDICGNPITSDMFYIKSVEPYNKPMTGREKRENKRLQKMMNDIMTRTKQEENNVD